MSEPESSRAADRPDRRLLKVLLLIMLLLAVAFTAGLLLPRLAIFSYDPGETTGDSADIRLVGVWAENSFKLRDASGRVTGETLGILKWPRRQDEDYRFRYFIFDLPEPPSGLEFSRLALMSLGDGRGSASRYESLEIYPMSRDGRRICARFQIPRTYTKYPWFIPRLFGADARALPVDKIDLTLRYRPPERGGAEVTFLGPFQPGETRVPEESKPGTVEVSRYYGFGRKHGTLLHCKGLPVGDRVEAFGYDREGRRHSAGWLSGVRDPRDFTLGIPDLHPRDLSAFTINERVFEKTFHNIAVAYDDLDDDAPADCLAELCKVYDIPLYPPGRDGTVPTVFDPGDCRSALWDGIRKSDPAAVAAVAGFLRGSLLEIALSPLQYPQGRAPVVKISDDDRKRLAEAATALSRADDAGTAACAVSIGLIAGFDAFFDTAMDLLESGVDEDAMHMDNLSYGGSGYDPSYQVVVMLKILCADRARLTDERLRRLGDFALEDDFLWTAGGHIRECLEKSPSPEAARVLADLARDERPWYWCNALAGRKAVAALGPFDSWPDDLKSRYIIANRFSDESTAAFPEAVADAEAALAGLLTPAFRNYGGRACAAVLDGLAERLPPSEATDALASFVTMHYDYKNNSRNVIRAMTLINRLNGIDIGGYASADDGIPRAQDGSIAQAVDDLVTWRDTGRVPTLLPEGYRAGPDDLRIICLNEGNPDAVAVGLWRPPADSKVACHVWRIDCPACTLFYTIEPAPPGYGGRGGPPVDYIFEAWITSFLDKYPDRDSWNDIEINLSSLPFQSRLTKGWRVVIEPADSPDSVISDTQVFKDWWEKYGP